MKRQADEAQKKIDFATQQAADAQKKIDLAKQQIDLAKNNYTAEMHTSKGIIRLNFLPEVAPEHVKNFLALAQTGFYNGLTFHRVSKGKSPLIQGGCPLGTGLGGPGYQVKAKEFNQTPVDAGVLSIPGAWPAPYGLGSGGSVFSIYPESRKTLIGNAIVIGRTADEESLKTVRAIGMVQTGANARPLEPVVIERVTVKETPK